MGRTFSEFRYRLEFGREESAFVEFFNSPPPDVVSFRSNEVGITKSCKTTADDFKEAVDDFERDLNLTEDELDKNFQDFYRVQKIAGDAYMAVRNGLISLKVISLVHLIIRFRLK